MTTEGLIVRPGEGTSVWLGGPGVDFKLWGEDTGGQFAVVEHPRSRVGDQEVTAGPGCYVRKPRRVPHTLLEPRSRPGSWRSSPRLA